MTSPYSNTRASSLDVNLIATGGNGGSTTSGIAGNAGNATAMLYLTSTASKSPSLTGSATALGGNASEGAGGTAQATSELTSPYAATANATATGGSGSTPGAATATATAIGTKSSDNLITANATASSLTGSVGANSTATANTTSIGAVTGVAIAQTTGATGNAVGNSTAANAATGATDTVSASATAATNMSAVSTQTQANVGGSWFGNPGATSNSYAAYAGAMGLPSSSVRTGYLVSPTLNPSVYHSLHSSGSSVFGAGILGANYTATTGTYSYSSSNTQMYNLSGNNAFTLGLLTMGAYNGGFTSLTFTVTDGTTSLLTKTFTSLSAAQTYFTDDPVSLGDITGAVDLKLTYTLTAAAAQGAGISYLIADAPVTAASVARTATTAIARELPAAFAKYNVELATLSARAAASAAALSVQGRFDSLTHVRRTTGVLVVVHAAH
jgi:hypothetical protein